MLCAFGISLRQEVPDILIRHTIHRHFQQVFKLGITLDVFVTVLRHLRENRLLRLPSKFQLVVKDFLNISGAVTQDAQFIRKLGEHCCLAFGVKDQTLRIIILNDIVDIRVFSEFLACIEEVHITCALRRE